MIRWYDYLIAIVFAELLLITAFTVPWIGGIVAYLAYEYGWNGYCEFRKEQEN